MRPPALAPVLQGRQGDVAQVAGGGEAVGQQPVGHLAGDLGHQRPDGGQEHLRRAVGRRRRGEERRHQRVLVEVALGSRARRRRSSVAQMARRARIISRMRAAGWPHAIEKRLVMWGLIWLPRPRRKRPLEKRWRSWALWARVIGLRAKATAMPVPSSMRSRVLGGQEQRQERVVVGLGATTRRRSRPPPASGRRGDAREVTADASVDLHARSPSSLPMGVSSSLSWVSLSSRRRSSATCSTRRRLGVVHDGAGDAVLLVGAGQVGPQGLDLGGGRAGPLGQPLGFVPQGGVGLLGVVGAHGAVVDAVVGAVDPVRQGGQPLGQLGHGVGQGGGDLVAVAVAPGQQPVDHLAGHAPADRRPGPRRRSGPASTASIGRWAAASGRGGVRTVWDGGGTGHGDLLGEGAEGVGDLGGVGLGSGGPGEEAGGVVAGDVGEAALEVRRLGPDHGEVAADVVGRSAGVRSQASQAAPPSAAKGCGGPGVRPVASASAASRASRKRQAGPAVDGDAAGGAGPVVAQRPIGVGVDGRGGRPASRGTGGPRRAASARATRGRSPVKRAQQPGPGVGEARVVEAAHRPVDDAEPAVDPRRGPLVQVPVGDVVGGVPQHVVVEEDGHEVEPALVGQQHHVGAARASRAEPLLPPVEEGRRSTGARRAARRCTCRRRAGRARRAGGRRGARGRGRGGPARRRARRPPPPARPWGRGPRRRRRRRPPTSAWVERRRRGRRGLRAQAISNGL